MVGECLSRTQGGGRTEGKKYMIRLWGFKGLGVRGKIQSAGHVNINVSNGYLKKVVPHRRPW